MKVEKVKLIEKISDFTIRIIMLFAVMIYLVSLAVEKNNFMVLIIYFIFILAIMINGLIKLFPTK